MVYPYDELYMIFKSYSEDIGKYNVMLSKKNGKWFDLNFISPKKDRKETPRNVYSKQ